MVREMTRRLLADKGYGVLAAATVEQADEFVAREGAAIHLLLTDVIMPTMNGQELYQHLLARRPDLKVVFMSGYASDVIAPHRVLDKDTNFIQKPFTAAALFEKVREALGQ